MHILLYIRFKKFKFKAYLQYQLKYIDLMKIIIFFIVCWLLSYISKMETRRKP